MENQIKVEMTSTEEAGGAVSQLKPENAALREQSEERGREIKKLRSDLRKANWELGIASAKCRGLELEVNELRSLGNAFFQEGEDHQEQAELREQLRELSEKTALEKEELRTALGKAQCDLEISNTRCRELEAKLQSQATNAGLQKGKTGKELQGSGRGANGELPSTSKHQSEDCERQPPKRRRPEPAGVSETDEDGRTALHRAVVDGDMMRMRALLDGGQNTRARDASGQTPLHLALLCGREAAAELLVDTDCITDVRDREGRTPLHQAARSGCVGVVRKLIAGGADASAKDGDEWTPLHYAVFWEREAAVEALLEATPDCEGPDCRGRTPLHYAARKGLVRTVNALVSRGADLQAKDTDGLCPLGYALREGHDRVVRALLATYAWSDIEIPWNEMGHSRKWRQCGDQLLSECFTEMQRLEETRAEGCSLSLHDLARRHPSRAARRLSGEAIRRLSDRDLLKRDFPLFCDLLLLRLGMVRERRALEDCFLRCFPLLCPLPTTCTDVLLACLTNDDLRLFVRAVEP